MFNERLIDTLKTTNELLARIAKAMESQENSDSNSDTEGTDK